jgi:cell division protease FtsH
VTNGARGDIGQATNIARKMVCEWGMSEKMGMVEYGQHEDHVFLARDLGHVREYSEATAQEIDTEVRKLCDNAYTRAVRLLTEGRNKLEAIAKALLEYETLDRKQIREIMDQGRIITPPPSAKPPRAEPPPLTRAQGTTIAPDYPPGLTEAPA